MNGTQRSGNQQLAIISWQFAVGVSPHRNSDG
jgi:hypothetical protein